MKDTIIRLPQEIVLKIAAGEVVEKPASIVKELVENSIDAGASAITVEIQEGGIKYLRVVDNGTGIKENMLALAFERHSTSKLSSADDLFNIHTLGFRGEALASIAAVSKVTLLTKHTTADSGVVIQNEGGKIISIKPAAITQGTSITVQDLFFNTPVRLKFLKKPSQEASAITDFMLRLILSHPEISFRYVNNGKTIFHSVGDKSLKTAIARVYDVQTSTQMKKVQYTSQGIIVNGYVGVLDLEKSNRNAQTFFVNNRYFRSDLVSRALEEACKGLFTISKFPMCVLNITVPYNFVDVNVHPNKLEVRFADNEILYNVIKEAVFSAVSTLQVTDILERQEYIPSLPTENIFNNIKQIESSSLIEDTIKNIASISISADTPLSLNDSQNTLVQTETAWAPLSIQNAYTTNDEFSSINNIKHEKVAIQQNTFIPEPALEDKIRIIGAAFHSFLIIEYEEKLLFVDQHAAQERINFEKMTLAYKSGSYSQKLLSPILLELNAIEYELFVEYQEDLYTSGFEVSVFDETSIAVRAVPIILGEPMDIKDCIHEFLSTVGDKKIDLTKDIIRERILQSACKHSIKAGEKLNEIGIKGLIQEILSSNIAPTCPHGRPIFIEMTKNDLYKKFKRIQ